MSSLVVSGVRSGKVALYSPSAVDTKESLRHPILHIERTGDVCLNFSLSSLLFLTSCCAGFVHLSQHDSDSPANHHEDEGTGLQLLEFVKQSVECTEALTLCSARIQNKL